MEYKGSELELFRDAVNWKQYFGRKIRKYILKDVLEVGAGIGETTRYLANGQDSWLCLEPDASLAASITNKIQTGHLPSFIQVHPGTLNDLPAEKSFDTIIYIDVLEHIKNDSGELKKAISHLKPGGHLVVLVPAWPFLYNKFDQTIGHHRRYDKKMLRALVPAQMKEELLRYYDSLGYFASFANKVFLNQSYPSKKQIYFWNKFLVPLSTIADKVVLHSFGKSLIGVWQKLD